MINSIIKNEVFKCFKNKNFKEGERILIKLSKRINDNVNTETKRLILYNLAWVQNKLGKCEEAKSNILKIKSLLERDEEYVENNKGSYFRTICLYIELFKNELDKSEKIELNKQILDCCHSDIDFLDQALTCKFDIYELKDDIVGMKDVIEEIHTHIVFTKKIIGKTEEETKGIIEKLKKVLKSVLATLKEKSENDFNELCEELFNSTNSSIAI